MKSVENVRKRAVPPIRLRDSTQPDLTVVTAAAGENAALRSVTAARRRLRGGVLLLACALFVAAATGALVVPPEGSIAGSGVTLDGQGVVVSVVQGSNAWISGVRAGWIVLAHDPGFTIYGLGANMRPVPDDQNASAPPAILAVTPSMLALLLAAALMAVRLRRTGATVAVAAAVMSAPVWAVRAGVAGDAVAMLPTGLAAALAWQVSGSLGMRPKLARRLSGAMAAVTALVVLSVAVFVPAALLLGLVAGVAAASTVYVAAAWILVVRWRVTVASAGPGSRSRFAAVRAVVVDMLPFTDRMRRRGAQAERDRLASDLHAELLPAIASTAAELEQHGATEEAERLRRLAANVRDLVSDRRLPLLEDGGLVAAAEWLAESVQERAPLTIEIDLRGDTGVRQPGSVERAAYRVLQLALDNVMRHAEAGNAYVAISGGARSLVLTVADDGGGMDTNAAARAMNAGRLGLVDMRAEAESVGATLEIGPRVPHGTLVKMRWRG
jgi:signal transduction histidine kinase